MPIIPRHERMDVAGVTRCAAREFPAAVDALHAIYPSYDYVWDRQKTRWLVVRWLDWPARNNPCAIRFVEDEERGLPQDPGQHILDWLKATDIERRQGDYTAVLDEIDNRYERWRAEQAAKLEKTQHDMTAPFLDYIRRNPTSASVRGWRPSHLYSVTDALRASTAAQGASSASTVT